MAQRQVDPEKLMERETHIRWDEAGEVAVMWTATPAIRTEWKSYGFPIVETPGGGWRTEVPKDRLGYKPLKNTSKR